MPPEDNQQREGDFFFDLAEAQQEDVDSEQVKERAQSLANSLSNRPDPQGFVESFGEFLEEQDPNLNLPTRDIQRDDSPFNIVGRQPVNRSPDDPFEFVRTLQEEGNRRQQKLGQALEQKLIEEGARDKQREAQIQRRRRQQFAERIRQRRQQARKRRAENLEQGRQSLKSLDEQLGSFDLSDEGGRRQAMQEIINKNPQIDKETAAQAIERVRKERIREQRGSIAGGGGDGSFSVTDLLQGRIPQDVSTELRQRATDFTRTEDAARQQFQFEKNKFILDKLRQIPEQQRNDAINKKIKQLEENLPKQQQQLKQEVFGEENRRETIAKTLTQKLSEKTATLTGEGLEPGNNPFGPKEIRDEVKEIVGEFKKKREAGLNPDLDQLVDQHAEKLAGIAPVISSGVIEESQIDRVQDLGDDIITNVTELRNKLNQKMEQNFTPEEATQFGVRYIKRRVAEGENLQTAIQELGAGRPIEELESKVGQVEEAKKTVEEIEQEDKVRASKSEFVPDIKGEDDAREFNRPFTPKTEKVLSKLKKFGKLFSETADVEENVKKLKSFANPESDGSTFTDEEADIVKQMKTVAADALANLEKTEEGKAASLKGPRARRGSPTLSGIEGKASSFSAPVSARRKILNSFVNGDDLKLTDEEREAVKNRNIGEDIANMIRLKVSANVSSQLLSPSRLKKLRDVSEMLPGNSVPSDTRTLWHPDRFDDFLVNQNLLGTSRDLAKGIFNDLIWGNQGVLERKRQQKEQQAKRLQGLSSVPNIFAIGGVAGGDPSGAAGITNLLSGEGGTRVPPEAVEPSDTDHIDSIVNMESGLAITSRYLQALDPALEGIRREKQNKREFFDVGFSLNKEEKRRLQSRAYATLLDADARKRLKSKAADMERKTWKDIVVQEAMKEPLGAGRNTNVGQGTLEEIEEASQQARDFPTASSDEFSGKNPGQLLKELGWLKSGVPDILLSPKMNILSTVEGGIDVRDLTPQQMSRIQSDLIDLKNEFLKRYMHSGNKIENGITKEAEELKTNVIRGNL